MQCPSCKKEVTSLRGGYINGQMSYKCKNCSNENNSLHSLRNCDNFVGHYDLQLGTYIESKEHKARILKERGLTQVSGTDSPRKSEGVGRIVCSADQYRNHKHLLGD